MAAKLDDTIADLSEPEDNGSSNPGAPQKKTEDNKEDQSTKHVEIQEAQLDRNAKIVVAGRSGAGKSTLIINITDKGKEAKDIKLSLDPIDTICTTHDKPLKKGMKVEIVDTPGLRGAMTQQLLAQSKDINKVDLLVYCLSIAPGSKFTDEGILQALQNVYGSSIWEHCVLVFTFSNYALDHCVQATANFEDAIAKYKKYIDDCARIFKKNLKKILAKDIDVKTIFQQSNDKGNKTTIIAIPAGFSEKDQVLPGSNERLEGWKKKIFLEMMKKCKDASKPGLLQLCYTRNQIVAALRQFKVVVVGSSGGGVGAAVGAGCGATAGAAGGPGGMVLGGLLGASVGIVAGVIFAAAATGVKKLRADDEKDGDCKMSEDQKSDENDESEKSEM